MNRVKNDERSELQQGQVKAALVLASASPRRRELLERIGYAVEVEPANADESVRENESPADCALRLAAAKAGAVASNRSGVWVLGADTVVALGLQLLGKPADERDATSMIERLAGREHEVITGVRLIAPDGRDTRRAVTTAVRMRDLSSAEIESYIASGEWRGKAGGYAIQGLAGRFVVSINGSTSNVVGLPLYETCALLGGLGFPVNQIGGQAD